MPRKNVPSKSPYEPVIGLSRAVRVGPWIAVSGTAPISSSGATAHPGDVYLQTKRCLEITLRAIEDAGANAASVIRTRVMLVDISRWRDAARAHGEVFGSIKPATTFMQVSGFIDPEWLVETEADCYVTSD